MSDVTVSDSEPRAHDSSNAAAAAAAAAAMPATPSSKAKGERCAEALACKSLLGVTWDLKRRKYKARVHFRGREHFLGRWVVP